MITKEAVKLALGITTTALDTEVQRLIDTAVDDLGRLGVNTALTTETGKDDKEVNEAIVLFVGWMRDVEGRGSAYERMYYRKAHALSMSESYREGGEANA